MKKCVELSNGILSIKIDNFLEILVFADIVSPIAFCNELLRGTAYHIYQNDSNNKWFVVKNHDKLYAPISIYHVLEKICPIFHRKNDNELLEILLKNFTAIKGWKSREEYKELISVDEKLLVGDHYIYRRPRR